MSTRIVTTAILLLIILLTTVFTGCDNATPLPTATGTVATEQSGRVNKTVVGTIASAKVSGLGADFPSVTQLTFTDNTTVTFLTDDFINYILRYPVLIGKTYRIELTTKSPSRYWFFVSATELDPWFKP
jgi:hypothetical protein